MFSSYYKWDRKPTGSEDDSSIWIPQLSKIKEPVPASKPEPTVMNKIKYLPNTGEHENQQNCRLLCKPPWTPVENKKVMFCISCCMDRFDWTF
jgi:hypothetical protein